MTGVQIRYSDIEVLLVLEVYLVGGMLALKLKFMLGQDIGYTGFHHHTIP
jgi:hypothetical protein